MFISSKKHQKIIEKYQKDIEKYQKILEETKNINNNQSIKIKELEKNFNKELEKQVKQKIDWYNKFAEKLLKESEKSDGKITTQLGIFYEDQEYKIARLIIERYLNKDELIKDLYDQIGEANNKFNKRQSLFNDYMYSLENDRDKNFFYLANYSGKREEHKTFYIAFLEQIDKLKSELELAKQELATQVANNIILTNELNKK